MSADLHLQAEQFIARERIEGLTQADRDWLTAHLQECAQCNQFAEQTEFALRSLRTAAISVPAGLATRTQFRVRLRAQELSAREPQRRLIWLACGISWIFGIASAPYVWQLFRWFGERAGVPKLVWELGFGLWWTIPAVFVAVVLLTENARQSSETAWRHNDK
jgi:hypothetical protein